MPKTGDRQQWVGCCPSPDCF